jgi:hypothetical protein
MTLIELGFEIISIEDIDCGIVICGVIAPVLN